ncbi:MAG: hypothetical protein ABDH29_04165 [Aquificaceae bacterium]
MFVIIKNPFTQEVTRTEFFGRLVMRPGDFISIYPGEDEELIELIESKEFERLLPFNLTPALSAAVLPFDFIARGQKLTRLILYFLGPQPKTCTVIVYPFYSQCPNSLPDYAKVEMAFILDRNDYKLAKVDIFVTETPIYRYLILPEASYIIYNEMEEGPVITYTPGEFEGAVSKYAPKEATTVKAMPIPEAQNIYYFGQKLISAIIYREAKLGFVAWFKLEIEQ